MTKFVTRRSLEVMTVLVSLGLFSLSLCSFGCEPEQANATRKPWTTSRVIGSPEPPHPYVTERAFESLTFNQCLDLVAAPGSDRLFIVEQSGKIFSFPNQPDVKTADLTVDLKKIEGVQQVYALAFHPEFEKNRYCYICYIKAPEVEDGTHVARFQVSDTEPPTIDVASEQTLVTWLSGGHNGCCLKFGPDGCLYISTGDGGPANPPDPLRAGQDLGNLLSAILRIDVDHADASRNYRIPADNPFVNLPDARGEIWAYGLRNPWRMSFDRKTGDFWVGDVGWELWEMLYRVERGGNYGWSVMEGRQPATPEWTRGPTPILPPMIEHPHSESSSITDGLTYYGPRLKELYGHHLYADYDTGKFWSFRFVDGKVVDHSEIADTTHRVVGFGEDHAGECYILDHTAGTIHRLVPNPNKNSGSNFPRSLSESGLFSSTADHVPAAGVMAYDINAQAWADHAFSQRLVAVPDALSIQPGDAAWTFPKDSVLVKTLSLDLEQGNPSSRRRIETQLLHFDGLDWQPYSYRWNDAQSDAVLVEAAGMDATYEVIDSSAAGGKRQQTWRFAGRAECQRCHNKWSGPPLAFNTAQLNRPCEGSDTQQSQLDWFARIKLIATAVSSDNRPSIANPRDKSADLIERARAYLHTNCAHCHRLHAGSAVLSKMSFDLPLDKTDMVGTRPSQGTFGIHNAQVIAAGDPFRSLLLYRMAKLGNGRMPYIGSTEIDLDGVQLMHEWIDLLGQDAPAEVADDSAVAKLRGEETAAIDGLRATPSKQDQSRHLDRLLSSTTGALRLLRSIDNKTVPPSVSNLAIERASQHAEASIRDLFERFLPAQRRIKRLGNVVNAQQILSLPGDVTRGRQLLLATSGVQCASCHRIDKTGLDVGPELTAIGKKYTRTQLLESILEPSKFIDPKFVSYVVETSDGRVLTGLMVKKDSSEVVLKDAKNELIRVPAGQIEHLAATSQSLMPELLLRDMTAQQVADLLEYLASLK